jgi:hypothetical protein
MALARSVQVADLILWLVLGKESYFAFDLPAGRDDAPGIGRSTSEVSSGMAYGGTVWALLGVFCWRPGR